eukprot:TRINITY_DN2704_c0_g1_i1.p1 TRINITY_DN2704_c0_g1~~TRINITY_DN2704_c0_g1_i1.p1  ORF type:complete len:421 (-),score=15.97 TRINITY_DN2704_c0_g1_i1:1244-2506(-)
MVQTIGIFPVKPSLPFWNGLKFPVPTQCLKNLTTKTKIESTSFNYQPSSYGPRSPTAITNSNVVPLPHILVAFSLFDFNGDESISFDELIIFFIATCRGIGKLTRVPVPKSSMLKEVAATLFYLYDVNNTKTLELKEIATWLETCKDFSAFLEKYEPKTKILEKKSLFASFPPNQIDAFSPEVLRANQISCSGRSTIEPRNVRKPRRLKAIRADFYSVNFSQLKMAKLLSSKIDKFTKNLYMQVPRPSLDVVTPVHKVVLQRESCLARLNTTLTGSWVSPKIFPKSSLYLDKERVNRESIPYQYFGGTTLKKTESADTKKRLFKFNKFTPKVLGPPIVFAQILLPEQVKEVPKEFMVYWKEAYDILQSVSEFNLHMYLSIVKAKPHLKNVFDKYLVLKSQTPTIACKMQSIIKKNSAESV